jgi:CBS domain-containing protein
VVLVLAPPSTATCTCRWSPRSRACCGSDHVVDALVAARSPEEVLAIPEIREIVVQPRLTVRDVMTQRVYRVYPDTPVSELLDLMRRTSSRPCPWSGRSARCSGWSPTATSCATCSPALQRRRPTAPDRRARARAPPAREIMSRSVMCVSEDQALAEVVSVMVNKDVERLPVVREGKLTGFLTRGDILRKLFGMNSATHREPGA